jgi:DNA-binding transcriptional regulator PaaX
MREKYLEFLNTTEEGKRIQAVLRKWGLMRDHVPWLPSSMSYTQLRRMVARLRSGKLPSDPRVTPDSLADFIERSMAQDRLVRDVTVAVRAQTEIEREWEQRKEAERATRAVASFHRLKQAAKAADPESPAAEGVRRLHRLRKKALGRRGKRRG